jgi:hypothetical protein
MRDLLSKAEHYQKKAEKYHELAKFARPTFLGDFYRGVAVRYVFMAQEMSKRAETGVGFTTERSPAIERGDGLSTTVGQDLELLAVWAGDRLRSGESK